ncbi:MAG: hypothetical protein R8N24_01865 [Alphaproteobacteria bacterium]|nr:hypothetical protein [Alphaproteobacteria bacterium]
MQKILMILICMFIGSAHATEMCAKNNTVVIPLDATVSATASDYNGIEWIWWATFPYGKIYGYGTYLSLQEVREIENNPDLTAFPYVLNTDSDELIGRNANTTDANGNVRDRFYYKMAHPMSSNWVYTNYIDTLGNLTYRIYTDPILGLSLRRVMFNAIGASMAEKEPETDTE